MRKSPLGRRPRRAADSAGEIELDVRQSPVSDDDDDDVARSRKRPRQRVSRACDQCRESKLKCNGETPSCSTCLDAEKPCSYGTTGKKRGLKLGYIRALECLLGLVIEKISESPTVLEELAKMLPDWDLRLRHNAHKRSKMSERLQDVWRKSGVFKVIEAALSHLDHNDESPRLSDAMAADAGHSCDQHCWVLTRIDSNTLPDLLHYAEPSQSSKALETTNSENLGPGRPQLRSQPPVSRPEPASNLPVGWQMLLGIFFDNTISWLPIAERHKMFHIAYTFNNHTVPMSRLSSDSGNHALLWASMAYTSLQVHDMNESGESTSMNAPQHCELYYTMARRLIPLEHEALFSIGHVQALLVLGLYRSYTGEKLSSWLLIQQATIIAHALHLNKAYSDAEDNVKEICQRVWLGCFVLDTLSSAQARMSPRIQASRLGDSMQVKESGSEEWEPRQMHQSNLVGTGRQSLDEALPMRALSTFNQLLRITSCLNLILCGNSSDRQREEISKVVCTWHRSRPEHCRVDVGTYGPNRSLPLNVLNLHLVHACLVLLYHEESTSLNSSSLGSDVIQALSYPLDRMEYSAISPGFDLLAFVSSYPIQVRHMGPDTIANIIIKLKSLGFSERRVDVPYLGVETDMDHVVADLGDQNGGSHNQSTQLDPLPNNETVSLARMERRPGVTSHKTTVQTTNALDRLYSVPSLHASITSAQGASTDRSQKANGAAGINGDQGSRPDMMGSDPSAFNGLFGGQNHNSLQLEQSVTMPTPNPQIVTQADNIGDTNPSTRDASFLDFFNLLDGFDMGDQSLFQRNLGYQS